MLKHVDPDAVAFIVENDKTGNYYNLMKNEFSATAATPHGENSRPLEKAHSSLMYNSTQLSFRISFFWRPVFNQSATDLFRQLGQSKSVPRLVVAGSGVWDIKLSNGSDDEALDVYARNLEQITRVRQLVK